MQADVTHPLSFLCCLSSLQQIFSGLNLLTVMVRVLRQAWDHANLVSTLQATN